jgi:LacI family transcriptional regulator
MLNVSGFNPTTQLPAAAAWLILRDMPEFALNTNRPRVALLVESSRAYGRGIMAGVAKYVREHEAWSVFYQELSLCDATPGWFRQWKGEGVITRLENNDVVGLVQRLRVPVVYLRKVKSTAGMPTILTDNAYSGEMCFQHFKERGFRHFAFCGFNGADYSEERRAGFVRIVEQAGLQCHVFKELSPPGKSKTAGYENEGLNDGAAVARWIKQLPKPVGVMACNDVRGQQVLNACRALHVAVPDEVAVIGVDNDEVLCTLSDPPLSSVVPDTERIGYETAELLARMMRGEKPSDAHIFIKPKCVITRRSTEVLAVEDRQIAAVLRFIREHACEGIDVSDVLRAVPMSRSTLDRRFIALMNCSPKDEILRARLSRAKQLLSETDFSLPLIAEKIGLEHAEYLSRIFKKRIGITPSEFRAQSLLQTVRDRLPNGRRLLPEDAR